MPRSAAVQHLRELFAEVTVPQVELLGPQIYALDAHLNDTLVDVHGRAAIIEYLRETALKCDECRVEVDDEVWGDDGVYLRWRMRVVVRRLNRGRPIDSIGMSHLRLSEDGLVINHQDYWDSRSGLFEYLPVVGRALRAISSRVG